MSVAHYRLCCISELHLCRISLVLGCMQIPWTCRHRVPLVIRRQHYTSFYVKTKCNCAFNTNNILFGGLATSEYVGQAPLSAASPSVSASYTSNNSISKWHKSDWKWSQIIPVRGSNLKVLWALRSLYINNIKTSKCGNDLTWTFDLRAMFTFYPTLIPADIKVGLLFWWRQYVFSQSHTTSSLTSRYSNQSQHETRGTYSYFLFQTMSSPYLCWINPTRLFFFFKRPSFFLSWQHAPLKGSTRPVRTGGPSPGPPSVEGGEDEGGAAGSHRGGVLL